MKILVQRPEARSSATLDDLRDVYDMQLIDEVDDDQLESEESTQNEVDEAFPEITQPSLYDHLAVKTESGWRVAEFVRFEDENNWVVRLLSQVALAGREQISLWEDLDAEEEVVSKTCILPIRPETEVVQSLSIQTRHRRRIIIQVGNPEYIDSMTTL